MKKEQEDEIGFEWQEISLEEARNSVLAGDGNYASVKQKLLDKLPALDGDKTIAFGLPGNKELDEKTRRGICVVLSNTLKKANLPWKVTYSGTQKLFICVPNALNLPISRGAYNKRPKPTTPHIRKLSEQTKADIIKLYKKGFSQYKVGPKLGIGISTAAHYIAIYNKSLKEDK